MATLSEYPAANIRSGSPAEAVPIELDRLSHNYGDRLALDSLSFESDFKAFMHSKVEEGVKRAALKKLFADPRNEYTRALIDAVPVPVVSR